MRERLSNRRASRTVEFQYAAPGQGGHTYTATIGYYDEAGTRPGEIFLSVGKSGALLDLLMRDAAIAVSIALQYGASVSDLRSAFIKDAEGNSESPLGFLLDILEGK